jgi:hypothetical protein
LAKFADLWYNWLSVVEMWSPRWVDAHHEKASCQSRTER